MDGILNILKPPGLTSHDVVSIVRRVAQMKKVGHTGTLDPQAAGVLPICLGQGTKVSQFLLDSTKKYRAEVTLGITTDTQDRYGNILKESDQIPDADLIHKALMAFHGEYEQVPPMYSALKQGGKKLYELARDGIEVERKPRRVTIEAIDILKIEGSQILFDVTCSKGTYVRTLCHDLGERLGCGGMMSFLLRTRTGNFSLEETVTLEELRAVADIASFLYPVDHALTHLPAVYLDAFGGKAALNGNPITSDYWLNQREVPPGDTLVRVYRLEQFIGLATVRGQGEQAYLRFNRLFV